VSRITLAPGYLSSLENKSVKDSKKPAEVPIALNVVFPKPERL